MELERYKMSDSLVYILFINICATLSGGRSLMYSKEMNDARQELISLRARFRYLQRYKDQFRAIVAFTKPLSHAGLFKATSETCKTFICTG